MIVDYDTFARLNPIWPKDPATLVGRYVRLHFKIENASRKTCVGGTVLRVREVSENGADEPVLDLSRLKHPDQTAFFGVMPMYVELEPAWYQPCRFCEGLGIVHECSPSGAHAPIEVQCPRCGGTGQGRRKTDARDPA